MRIARTDVGARPAACRWTRLVNAIGAALKGVSITAITSVRIAPA
jgi:hypothetical protein